MRSRDLPWAPDAPRVGDRVRTTGPLWGAVITGTVVERYRGFDWRDDEDGESGRCEPSVVVKVDERPPSWPYGDRDTFAPSMHRVTVTERGTNDD